MILLQEQVQIITLGIIIWGILVAYGAIRLRKIPKDDMPKLMYAAAGASTALTLVVTVLINMWFPQILEEYSIIALYFTGIVGGAIFTWHTLYEGFWKQIRTIEKRPSERRGKTPSSSVGTLQSPGIDPVSMAHKIVQERLGRAVLIVNWTTTIDEENDVIVVSGIATDSQQKDHPYRVPMTKDGVILTKEVQP